MKKYGYFFFVVVNSLVLSACPSGGPCIGSSCVDASVGDETTDAGTNFDAGIDGGLTNDGGISCADKTHDAVLGTLTLAGSATIVSSATLPDGIKAVGQVNGKLYGISDEKALHELGTLPSISQGPALAMVVQPIDVAETVYLGGFVSSSHNYILTGYTMDGFPAPGKVSLFNTEDAGVEYMNAPGNFTAAGLADGFVINGSGLGSLTGSAIYGLTPAGASVENFVVGSFDSALGVSASGYTAVTTSGIVVLGYADSDYKNRLLGVTPAAMTTAMQNKSAIPLAAPSELLYGDDISDVSSAGENLIVVRGGYEPAPSFMPFTKRVEKIPLSQNLAMTAVEAGSATTLVNAPDSCTHVIFAANAGSNVLIGVEDKAGRRVISLSP